MTLRGRRPKEQDNKDKIQDEARQEGLKSENDQYTKTIQPHTQPHQGSKGKS
jgi:hypothetical protein